MPGFDNQQNSPWGQGPLIRMPQQAGMGAANPNQQPAMPGARPMGPLGMVSSRMIDVGLTRGIDKGIAAGEAASAAPVAEAAGANLMTAGVEGAAASAAGTGMMAGMAAAAPWLAAGYLGGKALHLFSRGTGSVPFNNPADPFGFAKGGFVNPYMRKREPAVSPDQQPMSFSHSGGFGQGMVHNTQGAPKTVRPKGLPELHNRMIRPGGEI